MFWCQFLPKTSHKIGETRCYTSPNWFPCWNWVLPMKRPKNRNEKEAGTSSKTLASGPCSWQCSNSRWWFQPLWIKNLRQIASFPLLFAGKTFPKLFWLAVSTHLKNNSQIGNLPQIRVKIPKIFELPPSSLCSTTQPPPSNSFLSVS